MADMTPPAGAAGFLAAHGWAGARIEPLAGDASFRRYFRVAHEGRRAVLMDAPPPHEDPRPFLVVARWLAERGFAAPAILAADQNAGLVLLEDFGDARMREAVDEDERATLPLYEAAVDTLVALRAHPAGPFAPYDRAVLHREVDLLVDWYCPAIGIEVDRDGWRAAWDAVLDHGLADQPVTVLRDYHAENLMLLGEGRPLGLLDFQDALAGHPAYDLVSLLQDARRDVDPNVEEAMLARYQSATGDGDAFMAAYHVLGAQRNAKIIGIFTRAVEARRQAALPGAGTASLGVSGARPVAAVLASRRALVRRQHRARTARGSDAVERGGRRGVTEPMASRPDPGEVPETAMVMAAGLGTRMRPLTATRPKPLVEVAGKPLIDHVLDRLRAAGVRRAVVNVHYLADLLEAHLDDRSAGLDIVISDERARLMETGGGLIQARALLGDAPVVVVNSDNLWTDGPVDSVRRLAARWDDVAMDVLLLLVPLARAHNHAGQGDFHLDPAGRITRRRTGERTAPFVFTGVQVLHPRLLVDAPDGPFSTNLFWNRAIDAGRAFGLVHEGYWFDVGTPDAIGATEGVLANG